MIAADINVLLRAILEDDDKQSTIAQSFLEKQTPLHKLFISSIAIVEMVWVLKMKKRSRQQIYEAILDLIDTPGITIGNREVITRAIEKYAHGKADFGDYMILAEGQVNGCHKLASFDEALLEDTKAVVTVQEYS